MKWNLFFQITLASKLLHLLRVNVSHFSNFQNTRNCNWIIFFEKWNYVLLAFVDKEVNLLSKRFFIWMFHKRYPLTYLHSTVNPKCLNKKCYKVTTYAHFCALRARRKPLKAHNSDSHRYFGRATLTRHVTAKVTTLSSRIMRDEHFIRSLFVQQ